MTGKRRTPALAGGLLLAGLLMSAASCGFTRGGGVPAFTSFEDGGEPEQTIGELVDECQRNLRASPVDAQRSCRRALTMIEMDAVPEMYEGEKLRAHSLLGRAYYATGRIGEAVAFLDSVVASAPSDDRLATETAELLEEIDRLFMSLRITVADREIPVLAYIKGIDIEIEYPRRLTKEQRLRLDNLAKTQWRAEDEFQFVDVDSTGQPFMELNYFPVATFSATRGYSIIVEKKHRYRFKFEGEVGGEIAIAWEDEAGWELVERVPDDRVKVELPGEYVFRSEGGAEPLVLEHAGQVHMYVPADQATELSLIGSRIRNWERAYDYLLYAASGAAGLMALLGAR